MYVKLIEFKVRQEVASIQANMGGVIIWSDIDIVFLRKITRPVSHSLGFADICFVHEYHGSDRINGGFMAIRCNERTLDLFTRVSNIDLGRFAFHDQDAIHRLKKQDPQTQSPIFPHGTILLPPCRMWR